MINKLSAFFPVFNEEGNVEQTVNKAIQVLEKLKLEYEIIVVNDGSTDKTAKVLDDLAKKNKKIKAIHHPKNLGYGEALKSGFYNARYDTIVYTDGDGQFDFSEVTKFLEKIEDYDLVIGYRIKRQDSVLRKLFGKGWRMTLLTIFGLRLKDVDCGFKMVSKKVLEKIPHLESQRGAMINAELAIKASKFGFKVGQVGVNHYPRLSGKPTGANLRVIIKSYVDLLKLWWKLKNQKGLFFILLGIVALATFLRFYELSGYMTFLGDEGRDAIVVKRILVDHHIPLIGPPMSVGNIYLGPLYYYLMAIPMALFWLNPVAAAGLDAFLGVLTVILIYFFGKTWFNRSAGLIAAYLYAISPVTIIYSRSSWNPNPTPFFALLGIFSLYKVYKTGNFLWLILTGTALAAAIQMHYLALILLPIALIIWLLGIFVSAGSVRFKNIFSGIAGGIVAFLTIMSPLVWFDFRHNFLNYRALTELFGGGGEVKSDIAANIARIPGLYSNNLIGRYIGAENLYLVILISILVLAALIYKFSYRSWHKMALAIWLIVGLFGLTFYQQSIYDHYLNFLNPVPFLLFGSITLFVSSIPNKMKWLFYGGITILLIILTVVNLQRNPFLSPPNNQLRRTQDVAKFVIDKAEGKDFNFALIAKSNYDSAYQYYLDLYGHKPKQVPLDITEQLFVVCEDSTCDPTHNPKYEVAAFGWSKIDWMEEA
ncbi:MAG: glycosyltransferase, partial [Patescibacteria group bacterium]|nr:glycosyltransferase [Patescibacteria group bacterium]